MSRKAYEDSLKALEVQRSTLLAEVAEIDPIIAGLKKMIAKESGETVSRPPAPPPSVRPADLSAFGPSPYAGMEIIDATKKYLTTAGPRTTRQIAEGLIAGGFITKSKEFTATVGTMLKRDRAREVGIQKHANGQWYVEQK